jgi:DNA-binding response OmpR family regulator
MNGFEFLQHLKGDPARSSTPVLILSGLGQESDIQRGLELGAREFVVKTRVNPRELLAKVRKILAETHSPPR